jgi:nucleotide-binding universal stress UspA family protein
MSLPILCATDFSPSSCRMADAAAAVAVKLGAKMMLIHVPEAAHVKAAGGRLAAEAARLRVSAVTVEEHLLTGVPHESILEFCEKNPVRLVFMAARENHEPLARWSFGGLVKRVITRSPVPTIVVRDATVLEDWLAGNRPLRVFVAVNLASFTDIPLLWVKEFAEIGPCEIIVAYLNWIPDEVFRLGLPHISLFEGSRELQALLEKELTERCQEILGDLPISTRVEPREGRVNLPLIQMARADDADLFVVGTRLRNGFSRIFDEAVSVDVLHQAPMGVAVVPLLESSVTPALPVFDRVLVPVDFSNATSQAIRYACTLVVAGGTVHLLHVTHRLGISEHAALALLRALVPEEATARGIRFETSTWPDPVAAHGIRQVAARLRSDVICLSARRRSSLAESLLPSTAREVWEKSDVPVLLVRTAD